MEKSNNHGFTHLFSFILDADFALSSGSWFFFFNRFQHNLTREVEDNKTNFSTQERKRWKQITIRSSIDNHQWRTSGLADDRRRVVPLVCPRAKTRDVPPKSNEL